MSNIAIEDKYEFGEILDGDHENFKLIKEGDWEVDTKYQSRTSIVQDVVTGKYYSGTESRSGSPFTDYEYYSDQTLYEVVRLEETRVIVTWAPV